MKKFKLFTTIASLCLAVALMAFGVYAANNAEYNVNGSISFESAGVYGTWALTEVSVTGGTFSGKTGEEATKLAEATLANLHDVPDVTATKQDDETTVNVVITIKAKYTPDTGSTVKATLGVTENTKTNCTIAATGTGELTDAATAQVVTVTITFTTTQQETKAAAYDITFTATSPAA